MRPHLFFVCLLALCMGTLVPTPTLAQTPEQRPAGLRDAGVITRALPPSSAGTVPARPSDPRAPQANFPTAPTGPASSAALSDRAWTSTPIETREHGSSAAAPTYPPSQVVPAQFTNFQNAGSATTSPATANPTTGNPAAGSAALNHEPRPLKPPTSVDTKAAGKGSTGTVQMFISVLSSLAIVIGLIVASAWFYRKAAPTISGALPKQVVQVLGRTPLAPRQQLVLLRLGAKLVLVSNLHGEVRTISEITDPLEVDRLSGLCEAAQPGSISESFRSVLHNIGRNG